jgi:hypothetical protein
MTRLKKNNKGIANDVQVGILAIVALLIFSFFLYHEYTVLKDKMALQSCKNSIEAHSFVASASSSEIFTDIKCPTSEITIRNLKQAKPTIAEDMHRCWYIWGEGKGQYFEGDGVFCHICSIYQFGDKGKTVDGFMQYLATQNIQVKYPGDTQGLSYQDYFQGYSTAHSAQWMKENNPQGLAEADVLNTSQKYATIFMYVSGKTSIDKMLEGGGRSKLFAAGGITMILGTAAVVGNSGAAVGALVSIATGAAEVGAINAWNPVGWVLLGAAAVIGGYLAIDAATSPTNPQWMSFIVFRPYTTDDMQSLGCEKIAVNQMSNAGDQMTTTGK